MGEKFGKKIYEYVDVLLLEVSTSGLLQIAGDAAFGLMQDSDGVPVLPGTSIAGAVQDFLKEKKNIDYPNFWGENISKFDNKVYFFDSPLLNDLSEGLKQVIEVRKGHAHDKVNGGAADKKMFERTFLKQGCRFRLLVKVFSLKEESKEVNMFFNDMVCGIQKGWILFGGNKNNGAGQLHVDMAKRAHFNMCELSGLKAYYSFDAFQVNEQCYEEYRFSQEGTNRQTISITLDANIRDALLIKAEEKETDEEEHQTMTSMQSNGQYIIPGTTWKGILRGYCEKICNTIHGKNGKQKLLEVMFGTDADSKSSGAMRQCGKVRVHDTIIQDAKTKCYTRIKIDRFTGGTIDGAKLTSKPITNGNVTIGLDFLAIEDETLRKQAIALLFLAVRDLGMSKIPLGSFASVGFGRIQGNRITIFIPAKYRAETQLKEQENIDIDLQDKKESLICSKELENYITECIELLARGDI